MTGVVFDGGEDDYYERAAVHWNMVIGNKAMGVLMSGIPEHLLTPEANVYRLVLHTKGLIQHPVNGTRFGISSSSD
ncbi:hypothetical protein ACFXPS_16710 [Nocardia sp. NPDC059091]|uniref:hypothetical protein n=1 Tax=unclassified Nocardia TaxID=2637762 RepID=UPI0036B2C822